MSIASTSQMAIVILVILLISFNIVGSMTTQNVNNQHVTSNDSSQSLYALHRPLIINVIGKVHCYWCFGTNNYSLYSLHHQSNKHDILQGALVEVTCIVKEKILKGYGETNDKGEYNIIIEDFDECDKNETIICEAKPFAPPKDSPCNIPTKLNEGTKLKGVKFNNYEIVLNAKPFAYARDKECHESYHKPSPTPSPSSPSPSPTPSPSSLPSPSKRHA